MLASALTLSIAPFTTFAMIPTNFELIQHNINLGGTRSQTSAQKKQNLTMQEKKQLETRTATDSVNGKGEADELTDRSDPQPRAEREASGVEEERVRELLNRFGMLNGVRGLLLGMGGVLGLVVIVALG